MELLYVWIEDYKNIHHQGFNFNPRYRFEFVPEFDKTDKSKIIDGVLDDRMTYKDRENCLPDWFFGKNITNVTAIVGKNGAGKTTLIKAINYAYEFLYFGLNIENNDLFNTLQDYAERLKTKMFLLVYKTSFNFFIFRIDSPMKKENDFILIPNIKFIEKEFNFNRMEFTEIKKVPRDFKNTKLLTQIYYANNFENKKFLKRQVNDISNVGLIYEQGTDIDKYQKLFQDDFKRQVIFLDKNTNNIVEKIKKIQFNIPNRFNIKISTGFDRRYTVGRFLRAEHKENKDLSVKKMILYGVFNYIRTITNKRSLKNKYFYTDRITSLFENIDNVKSIKDEDIILDRFLNNIKQNEESVVNDIQFLSNIFLFNSISIINGSNYFKDDTITDCLLDKIKNYVLDYFKKNSNIENDNYEDVKKELLKKKDALNGNELNRNDEKKLELLDEIIYFVEYYNFPAIINFVKNLGKYRYIENAKREIQIDKLYEIDIEVEFEKNERYKDIDYQNKIDFITDITSAFSNPAGVFIELNWQGLSSGEIAMLNVFSRLYSVVYNKGKKDTDLLKLEDNVIITIDEGELYLHPEWQRRYFELIQKTLPLIYKDKNIQIIISSHSPFIISDIPKQNVIFIERDENEHCRVVNELRDFKQTFGANIHTLFTSSFFMDSLMGNFAKEKIDKAIEYLTKIELSKIEIEYCEQIISIIGEPIIKNFLQKSLDSKRLKKLDEIEKIKTEIFVLQHRLNQLSPKIDE